MIFSFIKKNFFFILVLLVFSFFFILGIDKFFTIEFFKQHYQLMQGYVKDSFFISLIFFYLISLVLLFFFLPVSAAMLIFSGFLFIPSICIPISILIITFGGTLNYVLLKKIHFTKIFKKASKVAEKIETKFKNNEIQYLLLLRLMPIPFIIQNAITVVLNVSLKRFFFSTLFAVCPYVVIYSLAGFKLKEIIVKDGPITVNDLINYENFIIIFLLFVFIFMSILLKKKLK